MHVYGYFFNFPNNYQRLVNTLGHESFDQFNGKLTHLTRSLIQHHSNSMLAVKIKGNLQKSHLTQSQEERAQ